MSLSTFSSKFSVFVIWLCLVSVARPQAQAEGSLLDLDIEYSELKVTLEKVLGENKQLRDILAETEKRLADMRKSLAASNGESEVFKRQSIELKLRMEALGLETAGGNSAKLEQRLLTAVSDLRVMAQEKKDLLQALVRLAEAASAYARSATGAPPEARSALESEIRNANQALGITSGNAVDATPVPSTISDGMAISVKDDLSLVVMNLGSKQGVKVGMPFQVIRGDHIIGAVQVVDVREKIAGAVIQNLSSEKERIKVGDRLKVDARQ
ncbi:MAG: hypothetical protein QOE70_3161 [Chthoniobacter sp.]|jgi:hypothetical protein|nr:hypothetical protein [Chthoniobacter sp.]